MNNRILDQKQRPLRDLRLSVTDRCNFRCRYCMPEELFGANYSFLPPERILSFDELERLARIFVSLGVKKIRITGGEPLLRKDIPRFIERLYRIDGLEDISITTNGSLLEKLAPQLVQAGLSRITVSLDSLNEARFQQINGNRGTLTRVLTGIEAAANAGLHIKINMVVQKGINADDIIPMAKYFKEKKHTLRFIEYMDVGNTNGWKMDDVITKQQILETIHTVFPIEEIKPHYQGEVATRYKYVGSKQEIGIISSVTDSFCSTCTRARVSAEGKLYTCLFASNGFDLRQLLRNQHTDDEITRLIEHLWNHRTDSYSDDRANNMDLTSFNKVEMSHIGG